MKPPPPVTFPEAPRARRGHEHSRAQATGRLESARSARPRAWAKFRWLARHRGRFRFRRTPSLRPGAVAPRRARSRRRGRCAGSCWFGQPVVADVATHRPEARGANASLDGVGVDAERRARARHDVLFEHHAAEVVGAEAQRELRRCPGPGSPTRRRRDRSCRARGARAPACADRARVPVSPACDARALLVLEVPAEERGEAAASRPADRAASAGAGCDRRRRVGGAVHHRRARAQAHVVRDAHDVEPLSLVHLALAILRRTRSTRISAPPPGTESRPAACKPLEHRARRGRSSSRAMCENLFRRERVQAEPVLAFIQRKRSSYHSMRQIGVEPALQQDLHAAGVDHLLQLLARAPRARARSPRGDRPAGRTRRSGSSSCRRWCS